MKKFLKILGIIFVGLILTIILGYYNFRYTAEDVVVKNNMTQDEYGWFVDVPNEQATIIMYQGALVDAKAYLPLAASIAEKGFDIYIMDSWFDLPIFGINQAQNIIDREPLQNVILMGHSLGGVVGSQVALSNSNIEGVVLLASYPAEGTDLSNSTMKVLSIVGNQDQVINRENYDNSEIRLPATTQKVVIDGGNHSQFGDYGFQKGDGIATISKEAQWQQVADEVCQMFSK